jgi:hypothetical protein
LYDHVKQSGFYTDVKDDLTIARPAFKDGSIVQHLEEDARDALAMTREETLIQRVHSSMYFSETLMKPLPAKQRREILPGIIARFAQADERRR